MIAYGKGRILGLGIVTSLYYYDNSWENRVSDEYGYPHRHKVTWIATPNSDIREDDVLYGDPPSSYGTLNKENTIYEISDEYTIERIEQITIDALFG